MNSTQNESKFTLFTGSHNALSSDCPATFGIKGIAFSSVDQFMAFCKAKMFRDERAAEKILAVSTPRELGAARY